MSNQGLKEEEKVKEVLQKEFGGLTKQKLAIGRRFKEFDLVSTDKQVVIEVKSFQHDPTKKNGYATTRKQRLIAACVYLSVINAKRKILALTDTQLYNQFKMDMDIEGLFPNIEIRFVDTKQQEENAAHPERYLVAPEGERAMAEKYITARSLFRNYEYMPDRVKRKLDIYARFKKESYKKADLAREYNVTPSDINNLCNSIEHKRKRFANSDNPDFLFDLSLLAGRILWGPLRQEFGNELKATPETVAILDPLELKKARGLGKETLRQTKEILIRYKVQHLMHPNWDRI